MRVRRLGAAVAIALSTPVFLPGSADAGGGCHRNFEQAQTERNGTTVEMVGNCFGATVLRVAPGAEVTWVNRDEIVHRVDGVGWSVRQDVAGGAQASLRFDDEGTYPYACVLHPGMFGAVVVGDGAGSDPVTNVATPASFVATPAAVDGDDTAGDDTAGDDTAGGDTAGGDTAGGDTAGDDDGWGPVAPGLGVLTLVAGFAGGRASRRGTAAPS